METRETKTQQLSIYTAQQQLLGTTAIQGMIGHCTIKIMSTDKQNDHAMHQTYNVR